MIKLVKELRIEWKNYIFDDLFSDQFSVYFSLILSTHPNKIQYNAS